VARVFVITGPSGVGKGTLIRTLRERMPELELSVSATTREPRPGEADGVDYHFLSDAEFQRRVDAGDFVEHATYSGRRYGTLRGELLLRGAQPRGDLLLVVGPAPDEPRAQRLLGRRRDEDLDRLAHRFANLTRALDLDLEHDRVAAGEP